MEIVRALLLIILSLFTYSSIAQEKSTGIIRGSLKSVIQQDSTVSVEIEYLLTIQKDTTVEIKALHFQSSPIRNLKCYLGGKATEIGVQRKGKIFSGSLTLQPAEEIVLRFEYKLSPITKPVKVVLPLPYPNIPTLDAKQGLFHGWIQVYQPFEVFEAFPTASWQSKSEGDYTDHDLILQAIPSMVTLQLGTGKKPFFSTLSMVDGFVILLLTGLMFLGWKKIRQV